MKKMKVFRMRRTHERLIALLLGVWLLGAQAGTITAQTTGKITLPDGTNLAVSELSVSGGNQTATVDANGDFQINAHNLTVYNKDGKVVYHSYVTMASDNNERQAELNAKETAASLLLPMFTSIYQGMTDEVMNHLKSLIGDLDETIALAEAIDNSIVQNGYLKMEDIYEAYHSAVTQIAGLSGIDQAHELSGSDIAIDQKNLEKATVQRKNILTGESVSIDGYIGTFDVMNNNRFSYNRVITGKQMLDKRFIRCDYANEFYVLPAINIEQFVNTSSTWDDIRAYIVGVDDTNYGPASNIKDIKLPLGANDEGVMILGPKLEINMRVYNMARTYLQMLVADIIGSTDTELQDNFYKDFATYLSTVSINLPNPDDPEQTVSTSYQVRYDEIRSDEELSNIEKIVAIYDITINAFQAYLKQEGDYQFTEFANGFAEKYDNEQTDKYLANNYYYRTIVEQLGENTMGALGLNDDDTGIPVEGLDIVQPKPTEENLYAEAAELYKKFVEIGNGKNSDIPTASGEFFYRPMWLAGVMSTLDFQTTGWNYSWNNQTYDNKDTDIASGFDCAYSIISIANVFLADLERSGITTLGVLEGEARALRDFCYIFLAQNWGRVPLRDTGETLENYQNIPYPDSDIEVWDFIINDLKKAADQLDWEPRDGEKGRCTKGMALSYLGEAYLWKAYRQRAEGISDKASISAAKKALEQVIDSKQYTLSASFADLWGLDEAWPDEAVWQFANEMDPDVSNPWSRKDWSFMQFYSAAPSNGGWGSFYLPWELFFLYEQGDSRRDASLCTSSVPNLLSQYRGEGYGYNPYTEETVDYTHFKSNVGGDEIYPPTIWTLKYWRKKANWNGSVYCPVHIYFKRYSGVLLDYAECLFRLNGSDDTEAWSMINTVRNRAFGNTSSEDAKTYYTRMTNEGMEINLTGTPETLCLPFEGKAEPWQVALGQEHRKEFNSEWNLRADLQRMDFMQAHMDCNFPKGVGAKNDLDDWHTYRDWDFNPRAMVLPLPEIELKRNLYAMDLMTTIVIGSTGKSTYTSSKALDLTGFNDLKAFVASGYESDGTIWLTRIKKVPANTPILIKGEAKESYEVPTMLNYNAYFENMFQGSTDEDLSISTTTEDGKYKNFYMASGQFKPVSDKGQTIKAGKCYLQVPASLNAAVTGEDQKVKINKYGKSSYAPPVDIDLTDVEGLKAYAATGYDPTNSTIWLTRINKIQAGEGVILKGEPNKEYTLPSAAAQAYYGNMIIGNIGNPITINETSDDSEWTNFYLASGQFKKVSGTQDIGTNKSYLHLPTALLVNSSSARGKQNAATDEWLMEELETETMLLGSIGGEDNGTTKIDAVRQVNAQPNVYYNLQGQRVDNPRKGLYIKNGVKVVIK